ncbi:MAG TPA: hypothetical protein VHA82_20035 [Ramlibacter sp.]|uniref:hypothetical protein n=1 Tax=Ramlibacter sp. TaxID=1917967 RepID=UPI002CEEBCC5|nr:hypothetical protein [Ramlibacter sp.]HVZ46107.1 hypothetical protein [Ramlibacter sp.]
MRPYIRRIASALTACALLALGGCASFEFTKPAQVQQRPITLKNGGDELSGWTDLPIGVYRVPGSQVVISGHQKGQGASLLFGLVGVAVAHAANASAGAEAVKAAEQSLHIKLDAPLERSIREITASPAYSSTFTLSEKPGQMKLLVTPGVILSFVTEDTLRPYVVLKATLMGSEPKPVWTGRYIASTGAPRALLGDSGWLENGAADLHKTIEIDLSVAIRTLATDVTKPYARNDQNLVMVEGNLPYLKRRVSVVGYPLAEDDQYLTFIPKIGDAAVFAGVNILDKTTIKFHPATKDDAVFKLMD